MLNPHLYCVIMAGGRQIGTNRFEIGCLLILRLDKYATGKVDAKLQSAREQRDE